VRVAPDFLEAIFCDCDLAPVARTIIFRWVRHRRNPVRMAAKDRTLPLDLGPTSDRNRRNLVIAERSGEGPFTIRFADHRYRALPTGGLLSSDLRPDKLPEGALDGSEGNEGGQSFREFLEIPGETPVSPEPGEGALDHPAARLDHEALRVDAPLDDLHEQLRHLASAASTCRGVVAAISPDQSSRGKRRRILSRPARPRRDPGSRRNKRRYASAALRCQPARGFHGL
jgi:hypothetical protein